MAKPKRNAECHPERDHLSKGLCRPCYTKQYRAAHPEKFENSRAASREHLKRNSKKYKANERDKRFGLAPGQYQTMLEAQDYRCASCNRHRNEFDREFAVDHDHACCPDKSRSCGNCVRGLLCINCNTSLGLLGDNLDNIMSLATYLIQQQNVLAAFSEKEQ